MSLLICRYWYATCLGSRANIWTKPWEHFLDYCPREIATARERGLSLPPGSKITWYCSCHFRDVWLCCRTSPDSFQARETNFTFTGPPAALAAPLRWAFPHAMAFQIATVILKTAPWGDTHSLGDPVLTHYLALLYSTSMVGWLLSIWFLSGPQKNRGLTRLRI